jgi:uncharacterized NAD-dependent epimerase/dehydratase family protein
MVLVHQLGRTRYNAPPQSPLPPLTELIAAYEQAAGFLCSARVVAVALNSLGYSDDAARMGAERLEDELGVPVADPIRHGCERLLDAALSE